MADVPSVLSLSRLPQGTTHVVSGGETLTDAVLFTVPCGAKLYSDYGPTEVTINSIGDIISGTKNRRASIGRPLPNVTAYVVSPAASLGVTDACPTGVWGEMLLSGVQVGRGYLMNLRRRVRLSRIRSTAKGQLKAKGHIVLVTVSDGTPTASSSSVGASTFR